MIPIDMIYTRQRLDGNTDINLNSNSSTESFVSSRRQRFHTPSPSTLCCDEKVGACHPARPTRVNAESFVHLKALRAAMTSIVLIFV